MKCVKKEIYNFVESYYMKSIICCFEIKYTFNLYNIRILISKSGLNYEFKLLLVWINY